MKNIKRIMALSLITSSVILSSLNTASAIELQQLPNCQSASEQTINLLSDEPQNGVIVKDITREEYVKDYAENNDISYKEADKIVEEKTEQSLSKMKSTNQRNIARGTTVWRHASWIEKYPKNKNYKAELSASFEIYTVGSNRQINSATVGSSLAAGQYKTEWKQLYPFNSTSFPALKATVGARGKFHTTITGSGSASISLPGFSFAGSASSNKTYVSDTLTIQRTYSLY